MSKVFSKDELNKNINILSKNWSIEGIFLKGSYSFNNFEKAFSFMKEVAVKCEEMNHHPKWTNVYNKLDIELYTHDSGGITEKDFELSAFMDSTFKKIMK
jgi:4a-hydroxytetrahydrobiopterin dehydratase